MVYAARAGPPPAHGAGPDGMMLGCWPSEVKNTRVTRARGGLLRGGSHEGNRFDLYRNDAGANHAKFCRGAR